MFTDLNDAFVNAFSCVSPPNIQDCRRWWVGTSCLMIDSDSCTKQVLLNLIFLKEKIHADILVQNLQYDSVA